MTTQPFEIRILDLHWINAGDDPSDLCAHGHVFVRIGDEIVCDKERLDVTVSSTALYLMRTLKNNYKKDDYASQLLPCCGHTFIYNETGESVSIIGCPNGIDWAITHTSDNKVKHLTDKGTEITIERDAYTKLVIEFADQVENFYKASLPKTIPTEELDQNGYLQFWNEWKKLRNKV